jgi:hypothetical protein
MAIMTKETAVELFGDLWTKMLEGEFGKKLKENEMTIKFEVNDPELTPCLWTTLLAVLMKKQKQKTPWCS